MNPEPRQSLDYLEAFLLGDVDAPLSELEAELRDEGVDVSAFLKRIEHATQSATADASRPRVVREVKDGDIFFLTLPSDQEEHTYYARFPLQEMIRRCWVDSSLVSIRNFFAQVPDSSWTAVLCRKTESVRSKHRMDHYALAAWTTRVIARTQAMSDLPAYQPGSVTRELMQQVVLKSAAADGPSAARAFLALAGIAVVVEPHLPRTYLDGAAIMVLQDRPIIGLTIRYDRLDNFWFTLLHELAHLHLHSSLGIMEFFDDFDHHASKDPREAEADALASEMLIPDAVWRTSPASRSRMPQAVESLAKKLRIHPAIVAGRMHHEFKSFHAFNRYVGHNAVRSEFPDVAWPSA